MQVDYSFLGSKTRSMFHLSYRKDAETQSISDFFAPQRLSGYSISTIQSQNQKSLISNLQLFKNKDQRFKIFEG